ncbi:MAG: PIN domain-containing protein [Thermodesulfobacteriota bacterium]
MRSTKDKFFLDTNILIYLYSQDELAKQAIAADLISNLENIFVISTQVIGEFANTLYSKFGCDIPSIRVAIDDFRGQFELVPIEFCTIDKAMYLIERYRFSYWDSMIIASALENECTVLYSEDLQHFQKIEEKLTIVNPFLDTL